MLIKASIAHEMPRSTFSGFCKKGKVAVQQFKIGRKKEVNKALNPPKRKIIGAESNCETASKYPPNSANIPYNKANPKIA